MTERLPANEPAQLYTTAILVNLDGNILPLLRAKFGYLAGVGWDIEGEEEELSEYDC